MRLRPGLLQRAHDVLVFVKDLPVSRSEMSTAMRTIAGVETANVLEVLRECRYVDVRQDQKIQLSNSGAEASGLPPGEGLLRMIITAYAANGTPDWGGLIQRGRGDFMDYADSDLIQCFDEAGLLDDNTIAAEWWDRQYLARRDEDAVEKLRIGRLAESKSMEFESLRTGKKPDWVSLQKPLSPYDLVSYVDANSSERLNIEVKGSRFHADVAYLHISSFEWENLVSSRYAVIHLWSNLDSDPVLIQVECDELACHLPSENGDGRWENLRIPFASFRA